MGDISRGILETAKKKIEAEGINPADIGIIGQNFSAEIATAIAVTESGRGKPAAQELAHYLLDDLERGMADLLPEEATQATREYLKKYYNGTEA